VTNMVRYTPGSAPVTNDSDRTPTAAHMVKSSAAMPMVVDSADTVQSSAAFVRTCPGTPAVKAANGQPQK
jgi:hypothetical protein